MSALRLQMSGGRERRGSPIGVKNRKVINLPARWKNSSGELGVLTVKTDLLPEVETMENPMPTEGSDNIKVFHFESNRMVALTEVHSFAWSKEKGRRLRVLRGEMIRDDLAKAIQEQGVSCVQSNIYKLETGQSQTVTQQLIRAICTTLGVDLAYFFSTAQITLDVPDPPLDNFTSSEI